MQTELRYLKAAWLTSVCAISAIICFNYFADPYCIYRTPSALATNHYKPAVYKRVRLLKAYEVRRSQPDAIVLGTSRSHLGIRPGNPLWKTLASQPYNLAFDGATTKEMYHYL